jgi:hypothetical protein
MSGTGTDLGGDEGPVWILRSLVSIVHAGDQTSRRWLDIKWAPDSYTSEFPH